MAVSAPKQAYTREETRRLLDISERQLRSWEAKGLVAASEIYGFHELVALRTLIKLRENRVPPAKIKLAVNALTQKLRHIEDPLRQLKLYADGKRIRVDVEGRAMEAVCGQLLLDFDQSELPIVLNDCTELISRENGLEETLKVIKAALPAKLRETAYAIACDLVASDGEAGQEELRVLELLRHRLNLEPLVAAAIERGARARFRTL